MQIKGIDHLVLRVADMERSLAFYRDLLGCAEERRVESIGLVQLRAGAQLIDLLPIHPGDGRNLDHFCLLVEPFEAEALRHYLIQAGVACGEVETRYGAGGYGPSIYIEDPDGNRVELKGPAQS